MAQSKPGNKPDFDQVSITAYGLNSSQSHLGLEYRYKMVWLVGQSHSELYQFIKSCFSLSWIQAFEQIFCVAFYQFRCHNYL